MYYDGTTGGAESLGLGYSVDGYLWVAASPNPVLDHSSSPTDWDSNYATFASVYRSVSGFHMWYSGGQAGTNEGIGYATSADGVVWTKSAINPIFHVGGDAPTYRFGRVYTPSVLRDELRRLRMYYSGSPSSGSGLRICLAINPLSQGTVELTSATASAGESSGNVEVQVQIVTLDGQPLREPVNVDFATADGLATAGQDYVATSGTLTFAAGTESGATQAISVNVISDAVDEDDETFTITLFNPIGASLGTTTTCAVTVLDDDTAGITVWPTSGLVTTEVGGSAQFQVVLTSEPVADVIIGISSSDTGEGVVSPSSLTFTSTDWNTAQSVTVSGVDDVAPDGDVVYSIVTAPAVSGDPKYSGRSPADVEVTNQDDEMPTRYYPVTPCRVFDTRVESGDTAGWPILAAGASRTFAVTNKCGLPSDTIAIAANATVVHATEVGSLTIIAGHLTSSITDVIQLPLSRARANNAIIQLANDGTGTIMVINNSSGTVHLILDVNGYFK